MTTRQRTGTMMFTTALALVLALVRPLDGMGSPAMKNPDILPALIPASSSWHPAGGVFSLTDLQRIVVTGTGPELASVAEQASERLEPVLARQLPVQVAGAGDPPSGSLILRLAPIGEPESYELRITVGGLALTAPGPAGFHHGVTTLLQLAVNGRTGAGLPLLAGGVLRDEPRFGWRGMLLDCGRHFMSVAAIKDLIDKLSWHKFNVLHWHLTEDQGWRLEIPGYPRLTEIGAWRTEHDNTRHGGFYTADDVREVVDYAAKRFITVVPEIEMPGHSQAALAAYPELSCTGGPFEVQTQWGIHEDVFCAGREETFVFLETVLTRVMELFPGRYLHIGGDEVPKDRWRGCPDCQARIRTEGLVDEDDLQSWFIARIARFLDSHDRRLIGWDEILAGGLPGDPGIYTVQAWRGLDEATTAARAGHDVICSPTSHAYFDYDPGVLDLQQVYDFQPLPGDLDEDAAGHILGGQMNLWTEYIPEDRIDTMLFPRMTAMAEALWTGREDRDFAEFLDRLEGHQAVLDHLGARPGAAARPLVLVGRFEADRGLHQVEVSGDPRITNALAGRHLNIRHLILESPWPFPFDPEKSPEDQDLPAVTQAGDLLSEILEIHSANNPGTSWLVTAALFTAGRPYGAPALLEISGHEALGAEISFAHPPSDRYPGGGPGGLVNGLHGSRFFHDGLWTGFEGHDLVAQLELPKDRDLRRVSVRFLQDANAWIFLPLEVRFEISEDGVRWRPAGIATHEVSDKAQEKMIRDFAVDLPAAGVRHVRVVGISPRVCPDWHPGRGQPCWIFADEIVCR